MSAPTVLDPSISIRSLVSSTRLPTTSLPPITEGQSEDYRHRLADINARACITDPLNILFQHEKTGVDQPVTAELLYVATKGRIDVKISHGACVVEAGNFAAVACWEPPVSTGAGLSEEAILELQKSRPIFAKFIRQVQAAKLGCLGHDQPYWLLSLMARDPDRSDKGAVRAVIEPYVMRAKKDGVPLWLIAGNVRARDVYGYFGFKVVSENYSESESGLKVTTWNMVCNWPVESVEK